MVDDTHTCEYQGLTGISAFQERSGTVDGEQKSIINTRLTLGPSLHDYGKELLFQEIYVQYRWGF